MVICFWLQRITNFRSKFFALPGATNYGIFILNVLFRSIKATITIHRAVVVAFACFRHCSTFVGIICDLCREISTSNPGKYKVHINELIRNDNRKLKTFISFTKYIYILPASTKRTNFFTMTVLNNCFYIA